MAQTNFNSFLDGISGKVGNVIFAQMYGKTVITKRKKSTVPFTQGQLDVQGKMRIAGMYVKAVMADPQAKAPYLEAAKKRNKPVAGLISGDFLNAPEVQEIDLSRYNRQPGDKIFIIAVDDFEVISVDVEIRDGNNVLLESGAAVKSADILGRWEYVATTQVQNGVTFSVAAVASDRPGNLGAKTVTVQ